MEMSTLLKVQNIEFTILCEFDRICKKHKIKYSLFGGTLLGAVRHKGFIPWDDDVDVCMTRAEFSSFCNHLNELGNDFFFQTHETDKKYFGCPKLRYKKSLLVEKDYFDKKICHGAWIDIMVLDHAPNSNEELNEFLKKRDYFDHIVCTRAFSKFTFKEKLHKFLFTLIHPLPLNFYFEKLEKLYSNSNILNGDSNYYFYRTSRRSHLDKKYFNSYTELEFCNKNFMTIKDYISLLTKWYGNDYMTLPPKEKRTQTHTILKSRI